MTRERYLKLGVAIAIVWLLTACSSFPFFHSNKINANPSSECQTRLTQQRWIKQLNHEGILVIQQGEQIWFVLPADDFFYTSSNHLLHSANPEIDKVIQLINTYPNITITVTGYTDGEGNALRNLALSRAQAQTIAKYLWNNGLDTRLVLAQGKGCANSIADNNYFAGRKANRRIEIFFRQPPPDDVFL